MNVSVTEAGQAKVHKNVNLKIFESNGRPYIGDKDKEKFTFFLDELEDENDDNMCVIDFEPPVNEDINKVE